MLVGLLVSSSAAFLVPTEPSSSLLGRRQAVTAAAAAALAVGRPQQALADKVVPKFFSTAGGVKYFDKEEGSCALFNVACSPREGDLVKIKYKAYLSNGKMFDSSDGPGRKPLSAKFKTGSLLPGWEEAMETMKEGGTRIIQVPPNMAYGEKGVKIENKDGTEEYLVPPNEKLQFELTLVQVAVPPP
uniref:peptidylprolyl isomerase n=1 Tax=Prymnesium polylepis TaxID=72548 RepID=A0A6T8DGP2_9EUKA|mmetsp:Transcript_7792/g.18556  ORF Transcript_7792/g.18556 Transcript_7792/m.18556 type:complete len:187 (+) Transcript_7792:46-606(+)